MSDDMEITNVQEAMDAVKKDGRMIREVPEEFITQDVVNLSIEYGKKDGYTLLYVLECAPAKFFTPKLIEICVEAVKKDRINDTVKNFKDHQEGGVPDKDLIEYLKFIPVNMVTKGLLDICLDVVKKRGQDIEDIPKEHLTADMCREAVAQDYRALEYIPDNLKTAKMCLDAAKQDLFKMLPFIPKEHMSKELSLLCLEKVAEKADVFKRIPDELKTPEICIEAVKRNVRLLEEVPENLKSSKIYFEAVKQDANILKKVPEEFITAEMCNEAVLNNPRMFEYVPDKFKTTQMCVDVLKKSVGLYEYIPEKLRTEEIKEVAKQCGYVFPAENVSADKITSMDAYMEVLNEQLKHLPPEVREQVLKSMGK